MEFEAFQQLWNEYDRKLGANLRLNTLLLQQAALGPAKRSVRAAARGHVVELIANVIAILLIGSFAAEHAADARFFIPSLVLGAYAVFLIAETIRQMIGLHAIDYAEPVVVTAKQLEQLRIKRISIVKWTLLTAPLLWMPLLIVGLRGFFGVDAYAALGPGYLTATLALGIGVVPLGLWASKRYADRFERSSLARALMDDLTGRSLLAALESLSMILRFENEG